jgi:hypothetical protein
MAKASSGNVFETRLAEIDKEIADRTKRLQPLQDRLRSDPNNADLRSQVQAEKQHFFRLADERGELARAVSRMAGGQQFTPTA